MGQFKIQERKLLLRRECRRSLGRRQRVGRKPFVDDLDLFFQTVQLGKVGGKVFGQAPGKSLFELPLLFSLLIKLRTRLRDLRLQKACSIRSPSAVILLALFNKAPREFGSDALSRKSIRILK